LFFLPVDDDEVLGFEELVFEPERGKEKP